MAPGSFKQQMWPRQARAASGQIRVSERHGKEGASDAAPTRSLRRILPVFAALLVSLTLAAAASANVSFTKAYGWGVLDGASRFETCTSTCQGGIEGGGGAGQLWAPSGVATDSAGDVYVTDSEDQRIDEFSAGGAFIKAFGWGVVDGQGRFETCTSTCHAGLGGGGGGQLLNPEGVATDSSGHVQVADYNNSRIDEFSGAGAFLKAYGWGVADGLSQFETCTSTCRAGFEGGGAGQFTGPWGVAIDPSGQVYVADSGNKRIDEFSAAGVFMRAYGWGVVDGASQFEACSSTCRRGLQGGGAGQLSGGHISVAIDPSGHVYVADEANIRIDEFSAAGAFIKAYGWGVSDGASRFETCTSSCRAGISGGGAGQLYAPTGVATDSSGDVYVTDYGNARIDEFSAAGAFIKAFGWGVVDGQGRFETCTSTCQQGIDGEQAGQLYGPLDVATDPSGDVYVGDGSQGRIDEFSAAGALPVPPQIRLAALGDSYSSGNGTPGASGDCARSPQAWPELVPDLVNQMAGRSIIQPDVDLLACSGAESNGPSTEEEDLPAQVLALKALRPVPTVITVTTGGDDGRNDGVGFRKVLTRCVGPVSLAYCDEAFTDEYDWIRKNEPRILEEAYRSITAADRAARVLAVGYPHIFKRGDGCNGYSASDVAEFNTLTDSLNSAIRRAAARVPGVTYVNTTGVFAGHELCSKDPWAVSPRNILRRHDWLHPNAGGQEAIAEEVSKSIHG